MLNNIQFKNMCRENQFVINDAQIEMLDKYVGFLLEWNKRINLISRKDTENIWIRHILSSIAILFKYKFKPESNVIDVGTGGGLPGIPLAILNASSNFMLLDSIQKKIQAVDDMINRLGLQNVRTYCGRAEEFGMKREIRHHYDYVIARAVASMSEIIRFCKPLLRITSQNTGIHVIVESSDTFVKPGSIILLKGGELESEITEAKTKVSPRNIDVYPIVIRGINTTEMFDKKIVIIIP